MTRREWEKISDELNINNIKFNEFRNTLVIKLKKNLWLDFKPEQFYGLQEKKNNYKDEFYWHNFIKKQDNGQKQLFPIDVNEKELIGELKRLKKFLDNK